jgi:hypothetical protein
LYHQLVRSLLCKIAGSVAGPFAVFKYVELTGKLNEIPVILEPLGDGFLMALMPGGQTEWYQGVFAAGYWVLLSRGKVYRLKQPQPVDPKTSFLAFAPLPRLMLRALGAKNFLICKPQSGLAD